MQVRSKIWLEEKGKLVFGEGKSEIFKAVQEHRSINKAAESMGVSFRRAWSYIIEIEKRLGVRLIERIKGGRGGGGSRLTDHALKLMENYDRMKQEIDDYANKRFEKVFEIWKK